VIVGKAAKGLVLVSIRVLVAFVVALKMKDIPVEWFVNLSQVWYTYCIKI
jgi:hypothetical protein